MDKPVFASYVAFFKLSFDTTDSMMGNCQIANAPKSIEELRSFEANIGSSIEKDFHFVSAITVKILNIF